MPWLDLRNVSASYDAQEVLNDISMTLEEGELLALLGPSGSGKTSLLRTIAGLISLDKGTIILDETDISLHPPYRRDIGMVFQSYALFPHFNLEKNIAFGLNVRDVPQKEMEERVSEIMQISNLQGLGKRFPNEISGGEQQRGALARALITKPRLLLLDEPFAALDKNLRYQMRGELKKIQQKTHITTIFVTHDQEEALQLADKMVVMKEGRLIQSGPAREIYERPCNRFVAEFVGEANFFEGKTLDQKAGTIMIRPENIEIEDQAAQLPSQFEAEIIDYEIRSPWICLRARLRNYPVMVYCRPQSLAPLLKKKKILIGWENEAMVYLT